ncbi:hypothetical protein BAUCODRAFT_423105 [Baudoinia panamericana UAMH 10762]|uniref:Uncharacterized protein n=1 Tax=Baudoinia panamericana (strain UAMH 10762) TaxID=717646 RepID=M2LUT7_BAUPA|nr:uncharacterized protein BAUCODRAFT_423105 [Baudoinia panamericana UAMH 10762]EMC98377.1 hypothetical protein BAUCODRAFT_423105 [Baudoinia panamericana UAMH 10762]
MHRSLLWFDEVKLCLLHWERKYLRMVRLIWSWTSNAYSKLNATCIPAVSWTARRTRIPSKIHRLVNLRLTFENS